MANAVGVRRDPVTPSVRARVLIRDNGCVAAKLGAPDPCRNEWGDPLSFGSLAVQLDHVKDEPMMGKRAPSDERHLVSMCPFHHGGWATANRPALRTYLAKVAA